MYDVFERKAMCWNTRLDECIKAKFHTQAAFREALNEKYGTDFSQQTISRWTYVGSEVKGAKRGFPELTNMFMIAETLGVDLGYLLGETEHESFTMEKACDYLGLSDDAIRVLKRITDASTVWDAIKVMEWQSRPVLNKLLTAQHFLKFIRYLVELDRAYDAGIISENAIIENLKKKLGSAMYAEAAKWAEELDPGYDGPEPSEEVCAAVREYNEATGNAFAAHDDTIHSIKSSKYELFVAYTELIEELYCNID